MNEKDLFKNILSDIKVDLLEMFDQNFEKKSFFGRKWDNRLMEDKGSLMQTSGKLRNSIKAKVNGTGIVFTSSKPYAGIHNEGGKIKVSVAMKKFFWAKYYENTNQITYSIKTKKQAKGKKNVKLNTKATFWQHMALKKAGSEIMIPQRQFIGDSPEVDKAVKVIIESNINDFFKELADKIKNNP
jgi:phage gpG-like protein